MNRVSGTFSVASAGPEGHGVESRQPLRFELCSELLLLDGLCIVAAFLTANFIRFDDFLAASGLTMAGALLPVYAIFALYSNACAADVLLAAKIGIGRALMAFALAVGLLLFLAFYLRSSAELSRLVLAIGTGTSVFLIIVARVAFRKYAQVRTAGSPLKELVITDSASFTGEMRAPVIEARAIGLRPDLSDPVMVNRLASCLKDVDRVIVACAPEMRQAWAMLLKGSNVNGELLTEDCDRIGAIGISRAVNRTTVVVSCAPLDLRSRLIKRVLDLAITVPTLIALAPLFIVTALAIKLDSPGPIFFTQRRFGRGNRLFWIIKFRSMRHELCDADGICSTSRGDSRITRVGNFIRKTSIDELPQLFNVLKGEMSLVGPRPHATGSTAGEQLFWQVDQRYWHRHAIKPGITGLAQIRGYRGATHQAEDLRRRLHADLEYLAGWTIWRDVAILARTLRVMILGNAY